MPNCCNEAQKNHQDPQNLERKKDSSLWKTSSPVTIYYSQISFTITDKQGKNRQSFGLYIFSAMSFTLRKMYNVLSSVGIRSFFPREKHQVQTNATQTIQAEDFPYLERRPYLKSRNIACFLSVVFLVIPILGV